MRKKARKSLLTVRQSPQRLWPQGLARRPFGSPWTPKTRGQSSAGTRANSQMMILSLLVHPFFPSKLFPAQFCFHLCFSSDIPNILSVPFFLISPWLQSIQTSSQAVCCSLGPLLYSVECFHEVEWRTLKGHYKNQCVFFVCLLHLTGCDVTLPFVIIQEKSNAWSTHGAWADRVCRGTSCFF